MKRTTLMIAVVALALAAAPALADHEDDDGLEQCEYSHNSPHYGLRRHDANDPASWPSQGDPDNPWVGSTSPTGSVYAGRFGGSEGNAFLSAGTCLEYSGAGSHGGVTEANVYEKDGMYYGVVAVEGGNDDATTNGYLGANTGYESDDGRVNRGGALCAGQRSGVNACTPEQVPGIFMCEPASSAGGPPSSQGGANWHDTSKNGCDLRSP
jgi:hypothetical protein